jgi:hypothetical protein
MGDGLQKGRGAESSAGISALEILKWAIDTHHFCQTRNIFCLGIIHKLLPLNTLTRHLFSSEIHI